MFNGRKPSILFSASLLLFVVTFLIGSSAQAQETSGIIGTLRDQTGAVIPGVSITVTNRATGLARTAVTTDSGDYSVLNLPVGIYNIAAELTGFKKAIVERVKLDVQHTARVDITLEVGEVTEQVTLVGVAPLLQTAESQVGTLIENRKVIDLPLNGRNFLQLNLLVAGAVEGSQGNTTDGQLRLRGSGQAAFRYLAPYIFRVAISNNRILQLGDGQVTFQYKESATDQIKSCRLPAEEFIRRFLQHVLPDRFIKVRYYGWLSPSRRPLLDRARQCLGVSQIETNTTAKRPTVKERMDAPRCPTCASLLILVQTLRPKSRLPP